jgi:hypothetical protein
MVSCFGVIPHIFITQKRIVSIVIKTKPKDSCKEMFSKLGILTPYSQCIFSILMFVVKHKDLFTINMELHKIIIRHKSDLHVPLISLTKVEKGVCCSDITLFNALPPVSSKLHTTLINLNLNWESFLQ